MNWVNQLPDSLRVNDDAMAEAYDTTGDLGRAWIKTTLALTRAVCGEAPDRHDSVVQPAGSGFIVECHSRPADWVVAVISPEFASGVRLAAAIMAARLAGVVRIVALLRKSSAATLKHAPAVLTALELLGVEDIFEMDTANLDELANTPLQGHGRVLVFGTPTNPFSSLPVWYDTPADPAIPPDNEPLRLHPELAGAWVHVNLHREFFTVSSVQVSPCTDS